MFHYWTYWQVQASAMGMDVLRLKYLNGLTLKVIGSLQYRMDVVCGINYQGRRPIVAYLEDVDRYKRYRAGVQEC